MSAQQPASPDVWTAYIFESRRIIGFAFQDQRKSASLSKLGLAFDAPIQQFREFLAEVQP
jgi:hypothetical protein